jgi:choline dehydrogenase-like flavoprotein
MRETDRARMQRAMGILCEIFLEGGARSVLPGVSGAPEIRDRRDLERFRGTRWPAGRFEASAYHPLGTARMAASPKDGAIGPDHQTHEVRDLYVVDGAAVPTALGVNPQVTIMALALRAGSLLSDRLG